MNTPKNIDIYVFSGTGNSLLAANWFKQSAESRNVECSIYEIGQNQPTQNDISPNLVGFFYPAHGFSLPWFVLKFILHFPRNKNNSKAFIVNCRAGMKLYKLFTPGLSGLAIHLAMLILWIKGYRIAGARPLDMPSNWISIHPGLRKKVVNSIVARCERIMQRFTEKMLQGKKSFPFIYFALIPIDIAIAPISLGYFILGRYFLAKTFFASHSCNSCRLCVEKCPVKAIEFKFNRPYWTFSCESCMRCMNICPKKSINTGHGYAATIIVGISAFPFIKHLLELTAKAIPTIYTQIPSIFELTIVTLICIPIMWLTYYLTQYLCKYKAFSAVFMLFSLTKYWRRYIAPTITAKSFKRDRS